MFVAFSYKLEPEPILVLQIKQVFSGVSLQSHQGIGRSENSVGKIRER